MEELIPKTMVNSGYGKNAQNVVQKTAWTALKDLMEDLSLLCYHKPCFSNDDYIHRTGGTHCSTESDSELGYMSCSVTTDGFISNCP